MSLHNWLARGSVTPLSPFPTWHDDVIKWKHFPRNWPFVRGIHRSPVNSPHKGQWRGALMFSLICARVHAWVNNREAGDLRRRRAHCDIIVMGGYKITDQGKVSGFRPSSENVGAPLLSNHVHTLYHTGDATNSLVLAQRNEVVTQLTHWAGTRWTPFRRRHFHVHFHQ